jgi:hypothetical protein
MDSYIIQVKRLLLLLSFFLIGYCAQAQFTPQYLGGTKTHVFAKSWLSVDSAFTAPKDTVSWAPVGSLVIQDTNKVYIKGADYWHLFTSAGALAQTIDTTWLSNRINQKQPLLITGSASQYFRGNLTLGDFSSDVLSVTDNTYAALSHTHAIGDVTGLASVLTSKQDQLVSGISIKTINGTSLLGSGNIDLTSGSGTGLINNVSSEFTVSVDTLKVNSISSGKITGTKTSSFISDLQATIWGSHSGNAPIDYNLSNGVISADTATAGIGLATKGRLYKSLDSLRTTINAATAFTPIGSLQLVSGNLSLKGDSTTIHGLKVYGRTDTSAGFYNTITFNNYTPVLGNVPVYDTANGGGYVNKPIQQITISKCQGCVPIYDTTAKNFSLTSYIPADFSGAQNGQILSTDIIHNKIVPIVPVYNNDSSLKVLMIDPVTSIPYIRNRILDDGGFTIYNDSTRRLGGVMNYAADFTATSGNYMHFNGAVGSDGLSPFVFASHGSGGGNDYGGGIGLDARPNGGSAFGFFATTPSSSRGRYGVALFDNRRNTYVWAIDSTGRQWLNYAVGTHSRLGLWDSTGKINILSNGTLDQVLAIGASGSPIWKTLPAALANGTATNQYLNWNGSAWTGKQIQQSEIAYSGTSAQYINGAGTATTFPTIPTNNNQLTNGSGYITNTLSTALTLFNSPTTPTGGAGSLYYDNSLFAFKANVNGTWKYLLTGASADGSSDFVKASPSSAQTASINITGSIQSAAMTVAPPTGNAAIGIVRPANLQFSAITFNTVGDLSANDPVWRFGQKDGTNKLFVDATYGSTTTTYLDLGVPSSPAINFYQSVNISAATLRLGNLSSDPTGAAGSVYFNTIDSVFKGYGKGGVWKKFLMEGDVSGSLSGLTTGYIPKATSSTTVGNSSLFVDASNGAGAQMYGFNTSPSSAIVHSETGGSGSDLFKGTVTGTLKFKVVNNGNIYSAGIDDGAGGYRDIVAQGGYVTGMQSKVLTDANYTITGIDGEVVLPIPSSTRTLTLPAASTLKGMKVVIHNRGAAGQWILSGSYIQTGNNGLTEDFVNSGIPSGKVIVLRSIDVGSGTYKWIQMNN